MILIANLVFLLFRSVICFSIQRPAYMPASTSGLRHVARIQRVLEALYPNPPIPLNSLNTFTFLVSVMLSAQTTDGKVNEVTKELFRRAATPAQLAAMSPTEVEGIIKQVGLAPKKAVYVVEMSKMLLSHFNGEVPSTYEGLESLPGVGHKTASVLMSQSFGTPAIAVDTHVQRLAQRWGLSNESNVDKIQRDLMEVFPREHWNKVCPSQYVPRSLLIAAQLHLQMIYFGREYCTAKDHAVNILMT
jgi:endonuclease-3